MGLGVLEDRHLEHVPGTTLLADMIHAQQHRYHGMFLIPTSFLALLTSPEVVTLPD